MTKWERIQRVRSLCLNTENSVLITSETDWKSQLKWMKPFGRLSIRTFSVIDQFGGICPHHPVITLKEASGLYKGLLKQGLHLIVAECIDPADCLFAGAALKRRDIFDRCSTLDIELARGPGTVRRVTNQGRIDVMYSYFRQSLRESMERNWTVRSTEVERQQVGICARAMMEIWYDDIIFEFSYYKKPVGHLSQHFIVWEITPAEATHL